MGSATIGVVDYGMGNLRSVQKAIERVAGEAGLGLACEVVGTAEAIRSCDGLILPGVGAFGDGMQQLDERGLIAAVHGVAEIGRPLLGVCLGMQLLFTDSTEGPGGRDEIVDGLGLIDGRVVAMEPVRGGVPVKVPQMGWNALRWDRDDPLFDGLAPGCWVYFVHGYHAVVADPADVLATADYGSPVAAVVRRGRVWGTQFHPEKSQAVGLKMLANFAGLVAGGVPA